MIENALCILVKCRDTHNVDTSRELDMVAMLSSQFNWNCPYSLKQLIRRLYSVIHLRNDNTLLFLYIGLIYLSRVKCTITMLNVTRLYTCAVFLAIKFVEDHRSKCICTSTRAFVMSVSRETVETLEYKFCLLTDWRFHIETDTIHNEISPSKWETDLKTTDRPFQVAGARSRVRYIAEEAMQRLHTSIASDPKLRLPRQ